MKTDFIPIDYDYFDIEGKNYARIIGRNSKGKRICVIDSCDVYLWAILKENVEKTAIAKLTEKIRKIKLDVNGRQTKVENVLLEEKNFLGKKVRALKIFATNYKDLHDIADQLDFPEIESRRGYDLGFITHYIIEKNFVPLNWYEVSGDVLDNSDEFGKIGMNLEVDTCLKLKEKKDLSDSAREKGFEPKALAYDIETDEIKVGEGEILMISLVSQGFKKVITWKKAKSSSGKAHDYVEYVKDEAELLERFVAYVKEISPDFLVGYFSDGFDLPYLRARAEKFRVPLTLGLDGTQPRFFKGGAGKGLGAAKISGIVHIDLLKFIQTAYSQYMQSETMSLNEVSNEFLGDTKKKHVHLHSSKIEGQGWADYYEYNLHDSVLTLKLFEKMWPDLLEFSRIMQEPIFDVSRNGMSSNVEDYITHNLGKFNEIPEKKPVHDEIGRRREREKYVGAFVFEPTPGLYEDLGVFDFTSFWPSIIVTFNLSKSTILEKKEKDSVEAEVLGKKVYFSKKPGFFPEMLKEIIEKRKKYKRELSEKPDVIKKARSNAFKLLANASYGYQGFFGARYYCPEASGATTAISRDFIKKTIEEINEEGYKTIYSDSVDGKTKVIVKEKDKIYEDKIENLFKKTDEKSIIGKEYNFRDGASILTLDEHGKSAFKPIKYVMRHKSNKKMYRVHFTNNWFIDVTEDHSLIGYESTKFNQSIEKRKDVLKRLIEIKPKELGKKASSVVTLQKIPNSHEKNNQYPKEVYEFMGYFVGDGSFMPNKAGKDYYLRLSLGSDKEEVMKKLIEPLKKLNYIRNYWWSKSREGDLTINGLKLVNIISKNFKVDRKKTIPKWLFEETEENISSFLRGLFSADGCVMIRNHSPIIKFTSIYEDYIDSVRKLLYRAGISHSVFKENSKNVYRSKKNGKVYSSGSQSKNIIIKNKEDFVERVGFVLDRKNKLARIKSKSLKKKLIKSFEFDLQGVKKIEKIETPEYVYDLEVEGTHTFFANYILAHNTDSIAFLMNKKTEAKTKGFLEKLNSHLPGVMELELEGFFKRGLWVTKREGTIGAKKKYALLGKDGKLKIRGFETVRRDWCPLARETQNKIIRLVLDEGNEKKALEYLKDIIRKIKERKIDREELVIKTMLQKPLSEYKNITPHVIAARKMQEKQLPITTGNLIEYYIAQPKEGEKKKLVRERVNLADEKGEYDIGYYLNKQVLPAAENIFQVFGVDVNEIIDGKKQMKLGDF